MKTKSDKGVAGLTILLSLIVMLFVIGLLVMIFVIMSGKLQTANYESTSATINNETVTTLNDTVGDQLSVYTYRDVSCSIIAVTNATGGAVVPASNYTLTGCLLKGNGTTYFGSNVNVSYTYTYKADTTATQVINDTGASIASTVDWFDIFIVIGAMVVLILLVVVIITAIRGSGMIDTGQSGNRNVGTA